MDTFFSREEALTRFKEVLADRRGQAVVIVGAEGSGKSSLLDSMVRYAEKSGNLHCDCNIHKGREVKETNTLLRSIGGWSDGTVTYINTKTVLERLSESVEEFGDSHRRVVGVEADLMQRNSESIWCDIVGSLGDKVKFIFTQRPDGVLAKSETFMKLPNVVRIDLEPQKIQRDRIEQVAEMPDESEDDSKKKVDELVSIAKEQAKRKEYEKALDNLDEALKYATNKSYILLEKGIVYREMGKNLKEFHCYDQAIENDPKYIQAYMQKAHALEQDENYEGVIECFRKGIDNSLKPEREAILWHNLAVTYLRIQNYEEANKCLDRSLELHDNDHTRRIKDALKKAMSSKEWAESTNYEINTVKLLWDLKNIPKPKDLTKANTRIDTSGGKGDDDYYKRKPTRKKGEKGCWLIDVPDLPKIHIEQYAKFSALSKYLSEDEKNIVITGKAGIGKSILALELVHSKTIQKLYPNGIIWMPCKEKRSTTSIQHQIAEVFQSGSIEPDNPQDGKALLKRLLQYKKFLIIFDDVENIQDVIPFMGLGKDIRIVVTTRFEDVEGVEGIDAQIYRPILFGEPTDSETGGKLHIQRRASLDETCLDAEEYADVLKEIIIGAEDEKEGFCFALYGNWGRGKTFLMEKVKERLKDKNYETFFFSAWKYPTTPEVWIHLYETFARKVFSFHSLGGFLRIIRAGIIKSGLWPLILTISSLAYFAFPKGEIVKFVSDKLSILVILFLIMFCIKAKYAIVQMSLKYLTPLHHGHKLGLQKIIGDDFIALLKTYIPRQTTPIGISWTSVIFYYSSWTILFVGLGVRLFKDGPIITVVVCILMMILVIVLSIFLVKKSVRSPDRVLLVIDDLDRCPHDKLIEIVESIKLLLEDEEVSKRIQVVMLVEEEVLQQSLAEKYKLLINKDSSDDTQGGNKKKRKWRIVNENIEKLFIGHLRLNPLTTKEVSEIVSKITQRDLKDVVQYEHEDAKIEEKKGDTPSKPLGVSKKDEPGILLSGPGKQQSNILIITDMAFTSEEHNILPESIRRLRNIENDHNLGPRSIRCFLFKYQLARLICRRLGVPYSPQMLADVLVEAYSLYGEEATQSFHSSEKEVLWIIAKQVC